MSTVPGEEPLGILGGGVPPGSPNLDLILYTSLVPFSSMPVLRGTALSLKSMRVFSWTWLQHTVKVFFNHDYLKVAVTHLKLKRQI